MGSFYMESTQINYRRDETVKTVDQKLQELSETSAIDTDIAPVFKSTNTYAPGDMVYYRNKLYTFNVEHTGAWAAGDVSATDVTTAIKAAAAVKADEADIAPEFDATASYTAGDLVYYGGIIYRCTNDHSGDWDADDFSATTISAELGSLRSGLTNQGGNITPATNVTNDTVDYSIISRMGNVVTVFVSLVIGDSISAWNKLADLSAGFRPIHTTMAVGWMTTTSEPCLVRIGDDGSIMISKAVSTGKVQFLASYIVN